MKQINYLLLFLILISCNNAKEKYVNLYLADRPEYQSLNIKFDKDLKLFYRYSNESSKSANKSYTVVNIINTDCGSCYETMDTWNEYLKTDGNSLKVIFVSIGKANDYFKNYFATNNSLRFDVYLDKDDKFCEINGLTRYKKETFLIDQGGNVILYGDPTKSTIIDEYYKYKLNEK
ncbi:redoxin domain-containing protein [Sediminibacterium sp.]|uniref:TlpA family protein disulfide reductase n=1 Tax=Sediminibacterium sp. TaxID=1917865 RepID=UPI0025D93CA0|nr:redoxin domain-containing protein [Sediminibacterium sp.]